VSEPKAGDAGTRSLTACILALAVAAGFVDAASYLGLGKIFTANMTGNTVLLGVAVATGSGSDAARAVTALGGFTLGVGLAVLVLGRLKGTWPHNSAAALLLEVAALVALLTLWTVVGVGSLRFPLIALSAISMGVQSAIVRAAETGGVATTYVTGTLTGAVARLVQRAAGTASEHSPGPQLPGAVWVIYALGALGGAVSEHALAGAVIAVPLAIVCVITAAALAGG